MIFHGGRTYSFLKITIEKADSILGLNWTRAGLREMHFGDPSYINSLATDYDLLEAPPSFVPIRHGIERDFIPEEMSREVDESVPYFQLCMKLY